MTFRQFAFNNVIRNKRIYAAYFLSCMFTVMVFFTFAMFAFHPALYGENMNDKALYGMAVAGGIIVVFSFFFVMYSMSSFLQSRKKEFGVLMVQGMSARQVRLMVFLENMLIGFFATVGGIGFGLIFAKFILLIAENVLIINKELDFYFPMLALAITFMTFIILFLFISFFIASILRTRKLIDLMNSDKQSKGEPKASRTLAIIAFLLLVAGYGTALYVEGMEVFFAMLPVVIIVIIGTYFFFTQLSVYLIRTLKNRPHIFWRKTNMILFSDLSFRMKDNARTFFMVAIISTVSFSAIGTLFGFRAYFADGLREVNPFSYMYYTSTEDEDMIKKDTQQLEKILREENIETDTEQIKMHYFEYDYKQVDEVLVVKASDYNRFATLLHKDHVLLKSDEAIVVKQNAKNMIKKNLDEELMKRPIRFGDGKTIQPLAQISSNALPEMNAYYIVSDKLYSELSAPKSVKTYAVWQAKNSDQGALEHAGKRLYDEIGSEKVMAVDYTLYEIFKYYGPIMFIGLFIGIVFFVSAGSFLYFRLYTDLDDDKKKFKAIAKIGLSKKELKKIINRQTAILFFTPIFVALVHGAVALNALANFFNHNLVKESLLVLGSFALIQIVYFFIVRHFYTKQIQRAIQ